MESPNENTRMKFISYILLGTLINPVFIIVTAIALSVFFENNFTTSHALIVISVTLEAALWVFLGVAIALFVVFYFGRVFKTNAELASKIGARHAVVAAVFTFPFLVFFVMSKETTKSITMYELNVFLTFVGAVLPFLWAAMYFISFFILEITYVKKKYRRVENDGQ